MDITFWLESKTDKWNIISFKNVLPENIQVGTAMVVNSYGVELNVKLTPEENQKECWDMVDLFNSEAQRSKSILVECDMLKEEHSSFERIFPTEHQTINVASFKALRSSNGSREIKKHKIRLLKSQMGIS
jgi:hypothetical protein